MALLSSLWLAGCSVFGVRDTPEPAHTLLTRLGAVEVRQYAARVAAETVVTGNEVEARSTGFRRLAGYIFGGNHAGAKIAMTAPVAQAGAGRQIAMTAPVGQERAAAGGWRIVFFMPAGSTIQNLPQPNDPAVQLVAVQAETYAVLRFSGYASPSVVADESARLLGALTGSAWHPVAAPVAWFYDPPWTLPPLRRNEVAVEVDRR